MGVRRQRRVALILAFWAIAIVTALLLYDVYGLDLYWYTILLSLLFMIAGQIISFGQIRIFFPFILFSKEDMSKYDVERISFFLGALTAILSCTILFISMSTSVLWIIVGVAIAIEGGAIYFSVAKRFRADV